MRLLVTGAGGFVGRATCRRMKEEGWSVRAAVRTRIDDLPTDEMVQLEAGASDAEWVAATAGMDVVVHLSARVHVLRETQADPLAAYREVNVRGTLRAAQAAAAAGVRRFVFMSTIGVHGRPADATPLTEESPLRPEDDYARSKEEAEKELIEVGRRTGMQVSILRSPLIYGPGNPGNFLRLLRWVDRGVPLPLEWIRNRRSLAGVANVADALTELAHHPEAAGNTFFVSDGEDLSTTELVLAVAEALERKPRLFGMPPRLLRTVSWLLGRSADAERLVGSLVVDSSKIRRVLSWTPSVPLRTGLRAAAEWYRSSAAD